MSDLATRAPLPVVPATRRACCHLGMDDDPFQHEDEPSPRHRCYLAMQRDRIDLAHQRIFCLSEASSRCPWLAVTAPSVPTTRWERVVAWFGEAFAELDGQRIGPVYVGLQRAAIQVAAIVAAVMVVVGPALGRAWAILEPHVRTALGGVFDWAGREPHPRFPFPTPEGGTLVEGSPNNAPRSNRSWSGARGEVPGDRGFGLTSALPIATEDEDLMNTVDVPTLLERGIEAAKLGDKKRARTLLRRVTTRDPDCADAWLWLASVAARKAEKRRCLEAMRRLDPDSGRAALLLDEVSGARGQGPEARDEGLRSWVGGSRPLTADTGECPGCYRLNRRPQVVCPSCGRPSANVERQLAENGDFLVLDGLQSLRIRREDAAHRSFAVAAEATPENALAWYWRARTAETTAEVVECLQRLVALQPDNVKARADLVWAMQRLERERIASTPAKPPPAPAAGPSLLDHLRPVIGSIGAVASFSAGLLWLARDLLAAIDLPELAALAQVAWLPVYRLPTLTWEGIPVGAALPVAAGVTALIVAWALADREPWTRWGGPVLGGALLVAAVALVANPPALFVLATLTIATVVAGTLSAGR